MTVDIDRIEAQLKGITKVQLITSPVMSLSEEEIVKRRNIFHRNKHLDTIRGRNPDRNEKDRFKKYEDLPPADPDPYMTIQIKSSTLEELRTLIYENSMGGNSMTYDAVLRHFIALYRKHASRF